MSKKTRMYGRILGISLIVCCGFNSFSVKANANILKTLKDELELKGVNPTKEESLKIMEQLGYTRDKCYLKGDMIEVFERGESCSSYPEKYFPYKLDF